MAVEEARKKGVHAERGTVGQLSFESGLFRIAQETDRALKGEARLMIWVFFSPAPTRHQNHHKKNIYSFKLGCREIFEWHPAYTCYSHKLSHHEQTEFIDVSQEWVTTSVLGKKC